LLGKEPEAGSSPTKYWSLLTRELGCFFFFFLLSKAFGGAGFFTIHYSLRCKTLGIGIHNSRKRDKAKKKRREEKSGR
jgi:hypothetical protein